jgi:hypothetical protein
MKAASLKRRIYRQNLSDEKKKQIRERDRERKGYDFFIFT